jgi:hypothetical protein
MKARIQEPSSSALPRTPCSQSDSGETLADIMDILKDLMEDMKPKGGRLREKMILGKAFDRYEQHRSTLTHGTSPMLACTCHVGMHGQSDCPYHSGQFSSAND